MKKYDVLVSDELVPKFEVIEDNGGGLYLFVFDGSGSVIYSHGGYEYHAGQLREDLENLRAGENPEDWDGNGDFDMGSSVEYLDGSEIYDELSGRDECEIVADKSGIYPGKMGAAASKEFGIEE